ncbi:hypothetical protein ACFY3N_31985 [Streptomyces sp. NPDC000348]|uniref:hypothetical protein n=1 Tax=Streptomyces sp. NPDC000348 TaxID=3364538 RepID=UPI00369B3DBA
MKKWLRWRADRHRIARKGVEALKADTEANLTWPFLVLKIAKVAAGGSGAGMELSGADEAKALEVLFEELDSFLSARNGTHGATVIIAKYLKMRG